MGEMSNHSLEPKTGVRGVEFNSKTASLASCVPALLYLMQGSSPDKETRLLAAHISHNLSVNIHIYPMAPGLQKDICFTK